MEPTTDSQVQVTQTAQSAITESAVEPKDELSGLAPDTVVTSPAGQEEKIIYDTDDHGNVVGWHKEAGEYYGLYTDL